MPRILFPEFRDQLEPTKYPFGETVSLVNVNGDTILEGSFLDAHLYPVGGGARMYLSKVVVDHDEVTFFVGDATNTELCSGSYDLIDPPSRIGLTDQYSRPAGVLISEPSRIALFQAWGIGTHTFELSQSEFAATCCMPTPEVGVRGILLADGTLFTGRTWIIGDDGVVVSYEEASSADKCGAPADVLPAIRVDVVGDPLFRRRLCEDPGLYETPRPVRLIRFRRDDHVFECTPNEYGNITMQMNDQQPNTALRIYTNGDGMVIEVAGSNTTLTD